MLTTDPDPSFSVLNIYDPDNNPVDRQARIDWWEQEKLTKSKIMVVGAGAIGNETLKNLALLGFGSIVIIDFDIIERSNLSRTVLFRADDVGKRKAEIAAARVKELAVSPVFEVKWFHGDVVNDVGASIFMGMDLVLGCLDNVAARLAIDEYCRLVGVPWIDAGIEKLNLSVTFYDPKTSISYSSTLTKSEIQEAKKRFSCFEFKKETSANGKVPTTQITAAIVGGIQAQEAVKFLCGKEVTKGARLFYDGLANSLTTYRYRIEKKLSIADTPLVKIPLASSYTLREFLEYISCESLSGNDCELMAIQSFYKSFVLENGENIALYQPASKISHEGFKQLVEAHGGVLGETQITFYTENCFSLNKTEDRILNMTLQQIGFPYAPFLPVYSPLKEHDWNYILTLDTIDRLVNS